MVLSLPFDPLGLRIATLTGLATSMLGNLNSDCAYNIGVYVILLFALFRPPEDSHPVLIGLAFLVFSFVPCCKQC